MGDFHIRSRIVERSPFGDHDGASGATLERATLDDGTAIVLKRFDPVTDLTMRLADRTVPVEVDLWRAGVFDRLPDSLGHTILDAWQEDGAWVVAMKNVDGLIGYGDRVSRAEASRIVAAGIALHDAFKGRWPEGLLTINRRVTAFSPAVMSDFVDTDNPLPAWVLEGWEEFDDAAPSAVRDAVHAIHREPERLTAPLSPMGGCTMLHGDYWTPNISLEGDRVIVIDWALATAGPPIMEFTSFLVGCADQVDATRDELVADLVRLWDGRAETRTLTLGLLLGVIEMGWNLASHRKHHPSPTADAAFEWWIEASERALSTGLLD